MSNSVVKHDRNHPAGPWLVKLGRLCAANLSPNAAMKQLEDYIPGLQRTFTRDLFTEATLLEVAEGLKFFPSYGELVERLRDCARRRAPAVEPSLVHNPLGAVRAASTRTEAEIAAVAKTLASWRQEQAEVAMWTPNAGKPKVQPRCFPREILDRLNAEIADDPRYPPERRAVARMACAARRRR